MQRPSPNCEIFEEMFYPNLKRFVWRRHAGAHPDEPYIGYIGMCRCEGYGFQAVYSRIGYINQSVWL